MSELTRSGRTCRRRSEAARGVRARRLAGLLAVLGLMLAVGGCGNDAQTLRPYTPAEGVNVDVGNPYDLENVVHVRNLLLISKQPGSGVLSASIVTNGRDQLTEVTGNAIKADGSPGAELDVRLNNTVSIANGAMVVLTDQGSIGVTSRDLAPGLSASMTMTFAKAGETEVIVPVVDGNEPQYASISPAPAARTPSS